MHTLTRRSMVRLQLKENLVEIIVVTTGLRDVVSDVPSTHLALIDDGKITRTVKAVGIN